MNRDWTSGEGWLPIGTHEKRYVRILEGNGHTISNLYIDRDIDYVGLFGGIATQGSIRRLGLVDAKIDGRTRVGILAGSSDGSIVDCFSSGNVSAGDRTGGLVGGNGEFAGSLVGSYSSASVSGDNFVGGLAGGNWGTIVGSHATGRVNGDVEVGGLAGSNQGSIVTSYATASVTGKISVGGLVGDNNTRGRIISSYAGRNVTIGGSRLGGLAGDNWGIVSGSYATGIVSGGASVGGLVGVNYERGSIVSSYAAGPVSGDHGIGGIVGFNRGNGLVFGSYARGSISGIGSLGGIAGVTERSGGISSSFWDIEATGLTAGVGEGPSSSAEGKSTAELKSPTSYTGIFRDWNTDVDDADGDSYEETGTDDPWDFGTANEYPALRADFDGDGVWTWEEFGSQPREGPPPSADGQLQPDTGTSVPFTPSPLCTNGVSVNDPKANPGLVNDCTILLQLRDALGGASSLDWSPNLPIAQWGGVDVSGTPLRVVKIQLASRSLSGSIPPQIGNLSALRLLFLRENNLTGGIPQELGQLSNLRTLNLSENSLEGEIPGELANIPRLSELYLGGNDLTGALPAWLWDLSSLQYLDLSSNRLTGVISGAISNLGSLRLLYLDDNNLSGTIPREIGSLSQLTDLKLNDNRLTGSISEELGNLSELQILDLRNNSLSGAIPRSLGNLSELWGLLLQGNRLRGSIPPELGSLVRLQYLYLADNNLSGTIPIELTALSDLVELQVFGNNLTGCVPWLLANKLRLQVLHDGLPKCPPTVAEGGSFSIEASRLLDDNTLRIISVSDPANGVILLAGSNLTYTHDGSETTTDSFSYRAVDGARGLTVTVTITITPVNDPPVGVADSYSVDEGSRLTLDVLKLLGNDIDPEGDSLSITALSDAINGNVSRDGASIIYEHDGSETTEDSFSYVVSDGTDSDTATVTIVVNPVNDPPQAGDDKFAVDEAKTLTLLGSALLENDTDAEGDPLSVAAVGNALNGTVFLDGTSIIYEHDGSETTSGGFTYTLSDGVDTAEGSVSIAVAPVNDPPVGASEVASVIKGGRLTLQAPALLSNDTDAEGDSLSIVAVADAVNGTVFLDGLTVIYEHDRSETTTGGFSYTVSDGTDSDTALVTISVTLVNDPPVAAGDSATVDEGATLPLETSALLGNDSDVQGDPLAIVAVANALNGTVSLDGTTITFEHDGSETTEAGFSYTVSDGQDTGYAAVTIAVTPVNDPPVAAGDSAVVDEGGTLTLEAQSLLGNDTDAENDLLAITAVGDALNGSAFLDGTTITYTHEGSDTTTGGFTYTVSDGIDTSSAAVTITVTTAVPVSDAPSEPAATESETPAAPMAMIALAIGAAIIAIGAFVVLRLRRAGS